MLLVVTGCPHNDYTVRLTPHGHQVTRMLDCDTADGTDAQGQPKYGSFSTNELALIRSLYPPADGNEPASNAPCHFVGTFTTKLPGDVGGAGEYLFTTNLLGAVGFYGERFRGNDDLAQMADQRNAAADQLTDLLLGWTYDRMWRDPLYPQLHRFLDRDFRRDLKNFGNYWWEGQLANGYQTNFNAEFVFRLGQYLHERGYFRVDEVPNLLAALQGDDTPAWNRLLTRMVARKIGIADDQPVPAALNCLTNSASLAAYVSTSDAYHQKIRAWQQARRTQPDLKQPTPDDVTGDLLGRIMPFELFGEPDHLTVALDLPAAPLQSNGHWDADRQQVRWQTLIETREHPEHLPYSCYALWVVPDASFQTAHLGRTALTGPALLTYTLWRAGVSPEVGTAWDAFLSELQPGADVRKLIDAYHFPTDPVGSRIARSASDPRELLKAALQP